MIVTQSVESVGINRHLEDSNGRPAVQLQYYCCIVASCVVRSNNNNNSFGFDMVGASVYAHAGSKQCFTCFESNFTGYNLKSRLSSPQRPTGIKLKVALCSCLGSFLVQALRSRFLCA